MLLTNRLFPLSPVAGLQRDLTRVMNEMFELLESSPWADTAAFPALNVWEDAESLYAEAEVPGLKMDDLEILVVGNELTIKGRRPESSDANVTYHRRERGTGEFSRTVTLPVEVNPDRVEATLGNGVLLITMPKAEQARARKITVKSG